MRRTLLALASTAIAWHSQYSAAQTQPAKPAKPTVLPIEHFTKYDEFGHLKLSPTGEYAAYTTGKYGRTLIVIIATKDKKVTGGVRCPDGFEIYDYDWISNERIVYQLAERLPGSVTPSPTGEMLAIDYNSKNQNFIYGYRAGESKTGTHLRTRDASYATAELVSPLFADDKNILIAEHPWRDNGNVWRYDPDAKPLITLLNVYNGSKKSLGRAPLADATILVDQDDAARVAIGRNEEFQLAVSWKPDPKGAWQAFDLPGFKEDSVSPRHFGTDNQSLFFTGVRENESLTALYNLNLTTHDITKIYAFDKTDVTGLVYDLTGKRIVGVVTDVDKPLVYWLDPGDRAAKIYSALYKAFPEQTVDIVSATRDGRLAIVFVSSDVNPGDYYLFDTQTMKADYFYPAKKWIVPEQMHAKEPFAIKARDGVELHGYLTRPNAQGPHPMIVLPHGGPHFVRDSWDFDWEVQLLANRGYAVLQVNFRGSGGFGMNFQNSGYREWGARMQDDITDATQWAIKEKHAQPERICIYGASYGGYAALMGIVREPSLYRCAIGYAGIYDLELMLSSADIPRSKSGRSYLQAALGDDREQLRSRSPTHNAARVQVPVLLIHGKEDWRADFSQAKNMKAALEGSRKEFEWMALSREGHGVYDEETRREVYERIVSFLDKHLRNTATAR